VAGQLGGWVLIFRSAHLAHQDGTGFLAANPRQIGKSAGVQPGWRSHDSFPI